MSKTTPLRFQTYLDTGDGPLVILLHGLFGNLLLWSHVIMALKSEYRVIVPRLPIFDLPDDQVDVNDLANNLQEFLDRHNLTDITLVGHAMGGQLALMFARHRPRQVRKLVLSGSSGLMEHSPFLAEGRMPSSSPSYVNEKIKQAFFNEKLVTDRMITEVNELVQNIPKRLALAALARSSKRHSVSSFLGKINQPVLLAWGLQDRITPPEVALHFHDLLPNAQVKFIDQCGHMPMVERPDLFNSHLLSFLREQPL